MGIQQHGHERSGSYLGAGYGQEKNQELIDYYKNRRVLLLYADDQPPKLVPYVEEGTVSKRK